MQTGVLCGLGEQEFNGCAYKIRVNSMGSTWSSAVVVVDSTRILEE